MSVAYRPFVEDSLSDVSEIVSGRLPHSVFDQYTLMFSNPYRARGEAIGWVAYKNDRPVCCRAHIIRQVFLGKKPILGAVGGALCRVAKGCPMSAVIEIMERTGGAGAGFPLTFSNTSCKASMNMSLQLGLENGPSDWACFQIMLIRPLRFLFYLVLTKVFKRRPKSCGEKKYSRGFSMERQGMEIRDIPKIEPGLFDDFWQRYLSRNEGVVSSRSAVELEWAFGPRLTAGKLAILGAFKERDLYGYIVVSFEMGGRWARVLDAIAIENSPQTFENLFVGAKRFLRTKTNAMVLECAGFPQIKDIKRRYFPIGHRRENNCFVWGFHGTDSEVARKMALDTGMGWFFGPYDGDMCL